VRDWLYVEDHCAGILLALERGRPGEKYNLGGFGERANVEIVDALCAELERIHPAADNPALARAGVAAYTDLKRFVTDRPGHDRRYAIDSARAQKELDWRPAHDLAAGLAATVQWYLDHRDWCEEVQSGRYQRERLGLGDRSRP
jgi:dTDP-glucose 4,6-dehydratase